MKKIVVSFLALFLLIVLGTTVNAASDFTLNELNFEATLNTDGSMNVVETWEIDVHSLTNTLFKTFILDNSKYSGISNVKVYEIDDGGNKVQFKEKNQEVLHVDKNCYYGLINKDGKYEIAWGINERIGEKTYQISYKIEDCIKKYNDISELYWKFIGNDFEVDINNVTGTLNIPNNSDDKETIKAWAHGPLNGNVNIDSAKKVSFEVKYFEAGNYVEVRLAMPNSIFNKIENVLETNRLETIIQEETFLADEANNARQEIIKQNEAREKRYEVIKNILNVVSFVLIFWFLTRINFYEKLLHRTPKLKPENPSEYFRDIPDEEATPADAAFLYYYKSNGIKANLPKVLSSTILSLALKKFIRLEPVETVQKKEQIKIVVIKKDVKELKDDEREIYELLKRIQDDKYGFNMRELEEYAKKHYQVFLGKLDKIPEIAEERAEKAEYYNSKEKEKRVLWVIKSALYILGMIFSAVVMNMASFMLGLILQMVCAVCAIYSIHISTRLTGLTQEGVNKREEWYGLKRFMEDYSMIPERTAMEVVLWEKYLVYATAFGVADKVIEQLKIKYPELVDGTFSDGVYLGMMCRNGLTISALSDIIVL